MGSLSGKRPLDDVEDDSDSSPDRCKRTPPSSRFDSVDLYSVPAAPQSSVDAMRNVPATIVAAPDDSEYAEMTPLSYGDAIDIGILVRERQGSKRYTSTIAAFVDRGLQRESDPDAERAAAFGYFVRMRIELERAGMEPGQAAVAKELMLEAWQDKMTAWLGVTIRSPTRLALLIESTTRHAEQLGRLAAAPDLGQALYEAVMDNLVQPDPAADLEDYVPPEHFGTGISSAVPGAETSSSGLAGSSRAIDTTEPDASQGPAQEADQPSVQDHSSPRAFASVRDLYDHHARKVKRKDLGDRWKDAGAKAAAKEEMQDEWESLSSEALTLWEELFARYVDGDETMRKPVAAAHLFEDGHASPFLADYPLLDSVIHAAGHSNDLTISPVRAPLRRASFPPSKLPFLRLNNAERIVFMRATFQCKPEDIAQSCRVALSSLGSDTAFEMAWWLRRSIIAVRFQELITARRLANKDFKFKKYWLRALPYPTRSPQVYIAHIPNKDNTAIRQDSIFPSLSDAFPDQLFHLRKEISLQKPFVTWILAFETPPNHLRFTIPMQQVNGSHKNVHFEPFAHEAACPVCTQAHLAWVCSLQRKVSFADLGLEADHPQYLVEMPHIG
ncbi:hypothetical protein LTR85_010351 [Meristemomyces frigidus]|nr:hypothetical protein LTR85_010351 [Meristemomyces frigidus]